METVGICWEFDCVLLFPFAATGMPVTVAAARFPTLSVVAHACNCHLSACHLDLDLGHGRGCVVGHLDRSVDWPTCYQKVAPDHPGLACVHCSCCARVWPRDHQGVQHRAPRLLQN